MDKDWATRNITNFGPTGIDLHGMVTSHASRHETGGADALTALDAGVITSGIFDVARIPDLDASKIVSGIFDVARIPDLDASKIISGIFDEDRIPHTFNFDVAFNSRGLGSGLRLLYVGDETEKSVYGTTETEIKNFRMILNTSHGRKYARIYFIGEAKVTGGTGYMTVSIDGGASQTVWTITSTSYTLHEGYIDVAWTDDTIHTISIRLYNSGSYYTYQRTLEVYVQ